MEYLKDVLNILCMLKGLPKWNELFIIILEIIYWIALFEDLVVSTIDF